MSSRSRAAEQGHTETLKLFLARDDVKADSKDANGRTLLEAAERGHAEVVQTFASSSRDPRELEGPQHCIGGAAGPSRRGRKVASRP
jgi:hypothetical protein